MTEKFELIQKLEKDLEAAKANLGVTSQAYLEVLREIGRLRGGANITSVVDQSGCAHEFETVGENPTLRKDQMRLPELRRFEPSSQSVNTTGKIEKQVSDVHMDMVRKEFGLKEGFLATRGPTLKLQRKPSIDNITKTGTSPLPRPERIEPVLVHAQNVHDYFEKHALEHKWNDYVTFTCAKPPFRAMLITYDHTSTNGMTRRIGIEVEERTKEYFEWYMTPESISATHQNRTFALKEMGEMRRVSDGAAPSTYIEMRMTVADGRNSERFPGRFFVMLGAMGEVLVYDNYGYAIVFSPEEADDIEASELAQSDVEYFFAKHGAIALATMQFMNCRNVEVVDNPPSRQQRRAAEREGKKPPVSYKTLVIHPVGKRRARRTGAEGEPQGKKALHIMKGHFKDYRQGLGLGRWHRKGMWWWGPQVRGSIGEGRVVKDYEVMSE